MKNKLKYLILLILTLTLVGFASVEAYASEEAAPVSETEDTAENFFTKIYAEISAYAGEILCALTFVGSVTLAFAYKKGLLPLIERSLVSIGNAIGKIKDSASENAEKTSALGENIDAKLTDALKIVQSLGEKTAALEKSLADTLADEKDSKEEKRKLYLIVNAQVDMLYDVFMSSALPQYQKDAVGERIAKMREAIAKNDTEH